MMTPQEVANCTFAKAVVGGYNMATVDDFLDRLTEDYTALYKENAALKAKLKVLADKMEEYRQVEDAMRSTLLTAQKVASTMVSEAEQKRDAIIADAASGAKARLQEIQQEVEAQEERLAAVRKEVEDQLQLPVPGQVLRHHVVHRQRGLPLAVPALPEEVQIAGHGGVLRCFRLPPGQGEGGALLQHRQEAGEGGVPVLRHGPLQGLQVQGQRRGGLWLGGLLRRRGGAGGEGQQEQGREQGDGSHGTASFCVMSSKRIARPTPESVTEM